MVSKRDFGCYYRNCFNQALNGICILRIRYSDKHAGNIISISHLTSKTLRSLKRRLVVGVR